MIRRHKKTPKNAAQNAPLPKIWLMTDERLDDQLLRSIRRMPAGSGVIFRHYQLPDDERHRLFRKIRRQCRRRGHMLFLAGDERTALKWRADGFHDRKGPRTRSQLPRSAPVHNVRELSEARLACADMLFVSPLFPTRSHPGKKSLGIMAFRQLAALQGHSQVIALGGMTRGRAAMLSRNMAHGWAAIDAFLN